MDRETENEKTVPTISRHIVNKLHFSAFSNKIIIFNTIYSVIFLILCKSIEETHFIYHPQKNSLQVPFIEFQ